MFGLFKKKPVRHSYDEQALPQGIQGAINSTIESEFRQMANERIRELEEKFNALTGHLGLNVYKPYHYVVEDFNKKLQNVNLSPSMMPTTASGLVSTGSAKRAR